MVTKTTAEQGKLTDKQEAFAIEYVLSKSNATEAARRAGYSNSSEDVLASMGYENLRNPQIIARIAQLREDTGVKTGANVEWLTSVLVSAIERCMANEEIYDREGNPTGVYKFDSKGVAANSTVLMKLMGWDKPKNNDPEGVQPVQYIAIEGYTPGQWGKPKNAE